MVAFNELSYDKLTSPDSTTATAPPPLRKYIGAYQILPNPLEILRILENKKHRFDDNISSGNQD